MQMTKDSLYLLTRLTSILHVSPFKDGKLWQIDKGIVVQCFVFDYELCP